MEVYLKISDKEDRIKVCLCTQNKLSPFQTLTCQELLTHVNKVYSKHVASGVEKVRTRSSTYKQHNGRGNHDAPKKQIQPKIIVALKTSVKNENIDYYLVQPDKKISQVIENQMCLEAVFSKRIK